MLAIDTITMGVRHTGDLWITQLNEGEGKTGVRTRGVEVGEGECWNEHRQCGGDTSEAKRAHNPLIN